MLVVEWVLLHEIQEPGWRLLFTVSMGDFDRAPSSHEYGFINLSFVSGRLKACRSYQQTIRWTWVNKRRVSQISSTCLIADIWCHHAVSETQIHTRLISPSTRWMPHKVVIWLEHLWKVSRKGCASSTCWKFWVFQRRHSCSCKHNGSTGRESDFVGVHMKKCQSLLLSVDFQAAFC